MDLNSKLIKLQIFHCSECENILNLPIMQVPNSKNICGRCYEKNKSRECKRNFELEEIIKLMEIPCCNKKYGCKNILPYAKLKQHELFCLLRKQECFMNCSWKDDINSIKKHFKQEHSDSLLESENMIFQFFVDFKMKPGMTIYNLLSNINGSVLFISGIKTNGNVIKIMINYLYGTEQYFSYCIKDCKIIDDFFLKSIEKKIIDIYNYPLNFESNNSISIDLLKLKHFNMDYLQVTIKIYKTASLKNKLEPMILSHLKCPICYEFMEPPINQCIIGHNICTQCQKKVICCPSCRQSYKGTRNFSLETLCFAINPNIIQDSGRKTDSCSNFEIKQDNTSSKHYSVFH